MTEDEAKTKWCPHVSVAAAGNPVDGGGFMTSRGEDLERAITTSCIGSECMAWRTLPNNLSPKDRGYSDKIRGLCGLAGKP